MIKRTQSYLASMPNLSLNGLSENWILKECGHQHWLALAQLFGLSLPEFKSSNGSNMYAAFIVVKINNAHLEKVQENSAFNIETQLLQFGRTRFYSIHHIQLDPHSSATIEMISTLVFRKEKGNNQSVMRSELTPINALTSSKTESNPLLHQAHHLYESHKPFRQESWTQWHDLLTFKDEAIFRFSYTPCPHSDFNGADFLYFANFQATADRAEWSWNQHKDLWQIKHRQLNYYGNINVGDTLEVECRSLLNHHAALTHWISIFRRSDSVKIADILTHKTALSTHHVRWVQPTLLSPAIQAHDKVEPIRA